MSEFKSVSAFSGDLPRHPPRASRWLAYVGLWGCVGAVLWVAGNVHAQGFDAPSPTAPSAVQSPVFDTHAPLPARTREIPLRRGARPRQDPMGFGDAVETESDSRDLEPIEPSPVGDAVALDAADSQYLAGDLAGAVTAYKRALVDFPDTPYLDQVLYRLGAALDALGRTEDGIEYWDRLLVELPKSPYVEEVGARLLTHYRVQRDSERVLDVLLILLSRAPRDRKGELLREISRAHLALADPERAIKALLRRQTYLAPEARYEALADLQETIATRIGPFELAELADRFPQPVPGAWIVEALARYHWGRGDAYAANRWLSRYLQTYNDRAFAGDARAMQRELGRRQRDHRHHVAVLIPAGGAVAEYGQRVLSGARLAYRMGSETRAADDVALWVRTIAPDGANADKVLRKLLRQVPVDVVIGPLRTAAVARVAEVARRRDLVMIAPLARRPIADAPMVALGIGPGREAVALARRIFRQHGLSRLIVLAPDGAYGTRFSYAFETEMLRLGGSVQETQFYTTGAHKVRRLIADLVRRDLLADGVAEVTEEDVRVMGADEIALAGLDVDTETASEPEIHIGEPLVPEPVPAPLQGPPVGPHPYVPGFDGVVIAGSWDQALLVVPHLPFQDINVPLFGTAGWLSPELPKRGGDATRGAEFVAGYQGLNGPGQIFSDSYRDAYRNNPDVFSALGFDAMTLALRAVSADPERHGQVGVDTRGTEKTPTSDPWQAVVGSLHGATGPLVTLDDGTVDRDFAVLQVGRRGFRLVGSVSSAPEPEPEPALELDGNPVLGVGQFPVLGSPPMRNPAVPVAPLPVQPFGRERATSLPPNRFPPSPSELVRPGEIGTEPTIRDTAP